MNHDSPLAAFADPRRRTAATLLISTVLIVTWWHFGSPRFYLEHLSAWSGFGDQAAAVYMFVSCFVLLGVIPALIVKIFFRRRLADYGVTLGDRRRTFRSLLIMTPVVLLVAWVSSHDSAVRAYYPIGRADGASPAPFGLHAAAYILFYLGWEFHFRGFLQYGLRESQGPAVAVLVQTLASTLAHLGRPTAETYAAIVAGVFWGWLAFRTRSLLSGLMQHALLGIALDWLIIHGR
jgi:membrane protease YdiL (CAAX protease family)